VSAPAADRNRPPRAALADFSGSERAADAEAGRLDRRAFLGAAGTAAAVLAVAIAAPSRARALGLVGDREGLRSPDDSHALCDAGPTPHDTDWHIDDMWGHAPRYAHPIPHSPARTSPVAWEHVEPIDLMLMI